MKRLCLIIYALFLSLAMSAATMSLDSIRHALELSSTEKVQEKVYIHTDNNAYFIGDTLWYKAYVVRADNLHFSDMSRILYVELLNPDGLLVERQQIIISDKGYSNGNFHITDSLYSGYYELRAYTRWMLNFNVTRKHYSRDDAYLFYSNNMASDFFRSWDGLYSRVFPVFAKPENEGDYSERVMYSRPKQRLPEIPKSEIEVKFYPEGGHLVRGIPNRVAFEVVDEYGAAVEIEGTIKAKDDVIADIQTVHMGRGAFTITPTDAKMKAWFVWNGKEYDFNLPDVEDQGVAVAIADGHATMSTRGLNTDKEYGVSILCRGVLQHFEQCHLHGDSTLTIDFPTLPTGVNDLTVFDSDGRIYADRLFFVNNHDYDADTLSLNVPSTITYAPYEHVDLNLNYDAAEEPLWLSLSVRDAGTDADTYDDGDIMTDLLLGSELKGFVANPAYYFETGDEEHAYALDLLMMVQGWRKYNWALLSDTATTELRYKPETTMTVEGGVYKMYAFNEVLPEEIKQWAGGQAFASYDMDDEETDAQQGEGTDENSENEFSSTDDIDISTTSIGDMTDNMMFGGIETVGMEMGVNHGLLKKEVYIEAELFLGDGFAGSTQMTHDGGRFVFEVPPYYGTTILRLKAYTPKDSVKMNMLSRKDMRAFDETRYSDFYVKRDLFYPIFASKYNYYQTHAPQYTLPKLDETFSGSSMESNVHELRNVNIQGRARRVRRDIDFTKPVYVRDMYDIYNDLTDYGLSWGKYDMRSFPFRAAHLLFGNMNRYNFFNVAAVHRGHTYSRNFNPIESSLMTIQEAEPLMDRTYVSLFNDLHLRRLDKMRVFTDFELRNEDRPMEQSVFLPDVTIDFVNIPDDGVQVVSRDRSIMLQGFNEPAQFYHRDYSNVTPERPKDYRRTLYWDPNATTDDKGNIKISFYNNSKQTRIKVTAAGITKDGKLVRR